MNSESPTTRRCCSQTARRPCLHEAAGLAIQPAIDFGVVGYQMVLQLAELVDQAAVLELQVGVLRHERHLVVLVAGHMLLISRDTRWPQCG